MQNNLFLTPFSLARGLYDEEMLWSAIVKSGSKIDEIDVYF